MTTFCDRCGAPIGRFVDSETGKAKIRHYTTRETASGVTRRCEDVSACRNRRVVTW
mgnify:CR=1 FL=1